MAKVRSKDVGEGNINNVSKLDSGYNWEAFSTAVCFVVLKHMWMPIVQARETWKLL